MTVNEQLKEDLLRYPLIIKNRWSCYHQWFCVTGNGLVWKNGELVDGFEEEKIDVKDSNKLIDSFFTEFARIEEEKIRDLSSDVFDSQNEIFACDVMSKSIEDLYEEVKFLKSKIKLVMNIDTRMIDFTQSEDLFPLCKDSILCNLPETNINDDWKNACKEFYTWLLSNMSQMPLESQELLMNIKTPWLIN